jgi:hypothetical protein
LVKQINDKIRKPETPAEKSPVAAPPASEK